MDEVEAPEYTVCASADAVCLPAHRSFLDAVFDSEDHGVDIKGFADFMRSTKAPSRGPITAAVTAGGRVQRHRYG